MDIKDLQKACSILGIDYLQFEESPEIEKGVGNVDYKALYEEQKALNENFLIQRIMEKKYLSPSALNIFHSATSCYSVSREG